MPWVTIEPPEFISVLERTGESEVRAALERDDEWVTHDGRRKISEGWLRSKESARRDEREIETLSIARSSLRWAKWASVIAIIAIISEMKDQISALIP